MDKPLTLIYVETSGSEAKEIANTIRKNAGTAQIHSSANFSPLNAEHSASHVLLMSCVGPAEEKKIRAVYGEKVNNLEAAAPIVPPPPGAPINPLLQIPTNWQTLGAAELRRIAAAVSGGRAVQNADEAVNVIKSVIAKAAAK